MPNNKLISLEKAIKALKRIRVQHEQGKPLRWTGPDKLHSQISATQAPPSFHFSPEGLAYNAERGRDFEDVYALVAMQLGMHQGVIIQAEDTDRWKKIADLAISGLARQ